MTMPIITNEMQAMLIAHFLWTSTRNRSARWSASVARSAAVATCAQLDSWMRPATERGLGYLSAGGALPRADGAGGCRGLGMGTWRAPKGGRGLAPRAGSWDR